MALYAYEPLLTTDGTRPVPGAVVGFYADTDTGFTAPLEVFTLEGESLGFSPVADEYGYINHAGGYMLPVQYGKSKSGDLPAVPVFSVRSVIEDAKGAVAAANGSASSARTSATEAAAARVAAQEAAATAHKPAQEAVIAALTTSQEAKTAISDVTVEQLSDPDSETSQQIASTIADSLYFVRSLVKPNKLLVYGHSYTPVPGFYVTPNTGEWSSQLAAKLGIERVSHGVSATRMIETAVAAIGTQLPGAAGDRSLPAGTRGVVVIQSQMNDALFGPHTAAGRSGFKHALRAFLAVATASQRIDASGGVSAGGFAGTLNTTRASGGSLRYSQGVNTDAPYLEFTGISSPTGKVHILTIANRTNTATGTMTIQVDGVDQGISYVGQGQMEEFRSTLGGGTTYDYSPAVVTVAVPTTGTHTVRVTRQPGATTSPVYVDALLIPSANPPVVLVCVDPPIGPYATQVNQDSWEANSGPLSALMAEVVAEFPAARLVDLGPGWDPATMVALTADTAKFHPNDKGMQHIADRVERPLVSGLLERLAAKMWG